jgi:hypothetical protein
MHFNYLTTKSADKPSKMRRCHAQPRSADGIANLGIYQRMAFVFVGLLKLFASKNRSVFRHDRTASNSNRECISLGLDATNAYCVDYFRPSFGLGLTII